MLPKAHSTSHSRSETKIKHITSSTSVDKNLITWSYLATKEPGNIVSSCVCCRKEDAFQGQKGGLIYSTWKLIVQGDTHAQKARDYWEGVPKQRAGG